MAAVCDRNCFECIYDDCICNDFSSADRKELKEIDREFVRPRSQKRDDRAYYAANREAVLAKAKTRRDADPEKSAAYRRAYYQKNCEEIKARQRAYYAANREKVLEKARAHYAANREKCAAYQREYTKTHREQILASQKRYRDARREELAAKRKQKKAGEKGGAQDG